MSHGIKPLSLRHLGRELQRSIDPVTGTNYRSLMEEEGLRLLPFLRQFRQHFKVVVFNGRELGVLLNPSTFVSAVLAQTKVQLPEQPTEVSKTDEIDASQVSMTVKLSNEKGLSFRRPQQASSAASGEFPASTVDNGNQEIVLRIVTEVKLPQIRCALSRHFKLMGFSSAVLDFESCSKQTGAHYDRLSCSARAFDGWNILLRSHVAMWLQQHHSVSEILPTVFFSERAIICDSSA